MAKPKTRPTNASVAAFIGAIPDPERRRDARTIASMMRTATRARAVMWGPTIVGFGSRPILGANGRATAWPIAAFAPRGTGLVLYFAGDFLAQHPLLPRLGKFRTGKGCLYIRRLSDVDLPTLRLLLASSIRHGQG